MPTTPKTRTKRTASNVSDWVFLNIPYDEKFEPLCLAYIAGLCGFGLIPRAVLEIPESERRLNRILSLIRHCRISFHDLSRVELDLKRPRTPRFNMPFELGLAVAWQWRADPGHRYFVFEANGRRAEKSLSDLKGTEIYAHGGKPRGLLRELTDVLVRQPHRPTVRELEAILADLGKTAVKLKSELRTKSLFRARGFGDLVLAARKFAPSHVASLRQPA